VYQYTYREAVIDGYLVDHEPPVRIVTALAEKGIHFAANTTVQTFNPSTKEIDTALLPDDVDIEIEDFNRQVITEPFNRTVCRELVQHIDPALPGKTVIFCVDNTHADLVVTVLKQELKARYEDVGDDVVVKITGKADKPEALLLRFRNERQPSVAVTVDLLTTGIDVPEIVNLVFLRRVKSRILYTQMLGRATRLCPEIGKQSFRIFDAVDLYDALEAPSQMKPVVPNPLISFAQLLRELTTVSSPSFRQDVLDQLVAKIQRRRQGLASGDQAALEAAAGMSVAGLAAHLRQGGPDQAVAWFSAHPGFADLLDRSKRAPGLVYISEHEDEVVRVEAGYGKGSKPKDYLDEFAAYLRDNMNHLPALVAVTQRPRELTRKQLRELKLLLDAAGYPEKHLQAAFRDTTNQDIAASIIGFIRRQTLGEALVPYPERVDRALARILGSRPWTDAQRKWLQRIGKQIKEETIVDREALDQGQFRTDGGFTRLNKVFDGKLEEILGDIQDALWQSAA
jgi:type I restriction enzyme R subunit